MRKASIILVLIALAAAVAAQGQAPAPQKDGAPGAPPAASQPIEETLSGVLAFADDNPAIKTDSGTVLLSMPQFYKYAYEEGFKAGMAVKAKGFLLSPQSKADKSAQPVLLAEEVTIGSKTYIIVGGGHEGPGGAQPQPPKAPEGENRDRK
jgi:hypothetical protein